jgi:hypothetical protein
MFTFNRQIVYSSLINHPDNSTHGEPMKKLLIVSVSLLLISGTALAGSRYEECIKEEKSLKTQEASECHGLRYLLNPSACFATQKRLKEYASTDRCKRIGQAEKVDFSAPPVLTEKKFSSVSTVSNAGSGVNAGKTSAVSPIALMKSESSLPLLEGTCEQLKEENARLKAEISRLTTELEQHTNACR